MYRELFHFSSCILVSKRLTFLLWVLFGRDRLSDHARLSEPLMKISPISPLLLHLMERQKCIFARISLAQYPFPATSAYVIKASHRCNRIHVANRSGDRCPRPKTDQ